MSDYDYHNAAARRAEEAARIKEWALQNAAIKREHDLKVKQIRDLGRWMRVLIVIVAICAIGAILAPLTGCGGDANPDCTATVPNTCRQDGVRNMGPMSVDEQIERMKQMDEPANQDDEDKDGEA